MRHFGDGQKRPTPRTFGGNIQHKKLKQQQQMVCFRGGFLGKRVLQPEVSNKSVNPKIHIVSLLESTEPPRSERTWDSPHIT